MEVFAAQPICAPPAARLDELSSKLDGRQAAAKTVTRKRAVLYNALDHAMELKALSANNFPTVKWTTPKTVQAIDYAALRPEETAMLAKRDLALPENGLG